MNEPRKMGAGSPLATEWNRMVDYIKSLKVSPSPQMAVQHTAHGTILTPLQRHFSGSGASGGVVLKWCQIQSIQDDYVTVKEWDWNTDAVTGDAFKVAKPYKLRYRGGASETVDGTTITFSSWATTTRISRTATISTSSEKQVIVPRLQVNDLIVAAQIATGVLVSSVDVGWQDINIDGRAWARKYDQS